LALIYKSQLYFGLLSICEDFELGLVVQVVVRISLEVHYYFLDINLVKDDKLARVKGPD
jgi:hypothetical protein